MRKVPPKLLGEAIERQQLVPREFKLPEFDVDRLIWDWEVGIVGIPTWGLFNMGLPKPPNSKLAWISPSLRKAKRDFDAIVRKLPEGLKRFLRARAKHGKTLGERFLYMACAYDEFRKERNALGTIALVASHRGSAIEIPGVRLRVAEDRKGKLSFELDPHPLYHEVVSREAEPAYIRECEIQKCRKIFWAGRIDQKGCSPVCQRAIRDRRHLDKKNKTKQSGHPRRRPTQNEKMARVCNAIAQGKRTYEEISKQAKLSLDEVSNLLAILIDRGVVKSRSVAEEREFYMTRSAKKGQ
jgi:hypothetical protein